MAETKQSINRYIDSTLLRPGATAGEVRQLCEEAVENEFAVVCINPSRLSLARKILAGSRVGICTVVGFPLGAETTAIKVEQARQALWLGAREIDMVMNLGLFKDRDYLGVREEIWKTAQLVHDGGGILKVIIETALLSPEEIKAAVSVVSSAGADYVKTSTGFGPGGANARDVRFIRAMAPSWLKIKAAGGIRKLAQALELMELGADRIGTSSAGAIMQEYRQCLR
ncbi:MAG: deoxyribose-phosphate aldolase [Syntrophomonadaceae bacterium]|nr:deoxyribose-phosphate aldolase [Syntrophomonadaceae bacterium]